MNREFDFRASHTNPKELIVKRAFVTLFCAAAVLASGLSTATAAPPEAAVLGWGTVVSAQVPVVEPTAEPPMADSVTPTPSAAKPRWSPTRRERRKFGLLSGGIRGKLRKLKEAGELDELRNSKGRITWAVAKENAPWIAAAVLGLAAEENPAAFAERVQATELAGRDWSSFFEALLAFLEKLIPLFLMFM